MAGNPTVAERMRKIATRMRERGLTVLAIDGWATRGRDAAFFPRAVVYHHTAAPTDIDRMLCDGRADLPGPLANFALHRDGTWVLVAAGRANHAGVATVTNSESYGIEATGPIPVTSSGPLAFPQYREYAEGVAAVFEVEGWGPDVGYGRKEVARPLGRKVDPAFDIPAFEQTVRDLMAEGPDMGLSDTDKTWLAGKFEASERRTARYVDHGAQAVADHPAAHDHGGGVDLGHRPTDHDPAGVGADGNQRRPGSRPDPNCSAGSHRDERHRADRDPPPGHAATDHGHPPPGTDPPAAEQGPRRRHQWPGRLLPDRRWRDQDPTALQPRKPAMTRCVRWGL